MKNTKTRKSLSILLALIMILSALPLTAVTSFAETSGDYEYTVLDDGTAEITKYNGSATELVIPSMLDEYNVTSIGSSAFYCCTSLTSITIPDSVTNIGNAAFCACSSLTGITIPDSVTNIGGTAFSACSSLTDITIPDSVTSIGSYTFNNCTSLTSITIPDSVTSIGYETFYGCTSLISIVIPNSVTCIYTNAFEGCTSLTSITVDSNNTEYSSSSGVLFNKDKTELICFPAGKTNSTYIIPDSITTIGERAFSRCTSLTSITIPDGVTSIGGYAFCDCTSLTSITIPDSVTNIGEATFYDCSSLTGITIPDSVTSIGGHAFYNCTSLTSITIPNNVTSIGWYAFFNCTSLTSITIPNSVTSIGTVAFGYISYYIQNSDTLYYESITELIDGFTIYGYTGSAAETYAKENNIKFVDLDGEETEPIDFPDVKSGAWYYDAAQYCAEKGYISGYANGNFGPNDNLKRQDFVVILSKIAGADLDKYAKMTPKLKDVKKGAYYAAAVNWAVDNNIIAGYANGNFGVNDNITREQVATILYRYMGEPEIENIDSTLAKFSDVNRISSFAKTAVAWAVQNNVISGMADGRVAPTEGAARAQIASIIMRMDQQGMFNKA